MVNRSTTIHKVVYMPDGGHCRNIVSAIPSSGIQSCDGAGQLGFNTD